MRELATTLLRLAAAAVLLTFLLQVTHTTASDPTEGSILRIAVRTTAGTTQDCRRLSPAELEALPMHMRRPEVCETRALPYRLHVRIDGRTMLEGTYTAAGIRGDRPLTVDEEFAVPAGEHEVAVSFLPESTESPDASEPTVAPGEVQAPEPAPSFLFEGPVNFPEGRIRVATVTPTSESFEIR